LRVQLRQHDQQLSPITTNLQEPEAKSTYQVERENSMKIFSGSVELGAGTLAISIDVSACNA
jgi:hypothetical protein